MRLLVLVITLLLGMPLSICAAPEYIARITYQPPFGDQLSNLMVKWANIIEGKSGGEVRIILYPGSQLIQSTGEILAVARGHIQGALISPYYWGRTLPVMSVISRPYFFPDDETWRGFAGSDLRYKLDAEVEAKGMKILMWIYISRFLAITSSNSPLVEPADFDGIKMRGLGPVTDVLFQTLNAIPVYMGGGESYQALQTRMIDGALTSLPSAHVRRFYEVQEYVTISPVFPGFFTVTINKDWWDILPDEAKTIIRSASREIESQSIDEAIARDKQTIQLLAVEGMKVHVQTPEEIIRFRRILLPGWTDFFLRLAGERGKRFLFYME